MINGNGEQVTVLQANPAELIDAIAEDTLFVPRLMSPSNVDMIGKLCTSMSDLRAQLGKLEGMLVGYRRELSEQRSEIAKLKRAVQELREQPTRTGAA
jgi:archaellum component FlaC